MRVSATAVTLHHPATHHAATTHKVVKKATPKKAVKKKQAKKAVKKLVKKAAAKKATKATAKILEKATRLKVIGIGINLDGRRRRNGAFRQGYVARPGATGYGPAANWRLD